MIATSRTVLGTLPKPRLLELGRDFGIARGLLRRDRRPSLALNAARAADEARKGTTTKKGSTTTAAEAGGKRRKHPKGGEQRSLF